MSFVEQYMGIKMQKELQQLAQLTAEQLLHLEFSQLNSKVFLLPVVSRFSLIPKVTVCRNLKFVNSPALLVRMVQVQRFLEKKILDFPSLCFLVPVRQLPMWQLLQRSCFKRGLHCHLMKSMAFFK
jgi:hypothetical protein